MSSGRKRVGALAMTVVVLVLSGCTRQEEVTYRVREDVQALPQPYQDQISEALRTYFGTASNPRHLVPDLDDVNEEGQPALKEVVSADHLAYGAEVYNRRCAGCHGTTGDGGGAAAEYLFPAPRDYRMGFFKFTSTPYGAKPRRVDLVRVIRAGAKGSSMPAFRWISDEELKALVDYVIMLSQRGELEYRLHREAEFYADPELADDEQELIEEDYIPELLVTTAEAWQEAEAQTVIPLTAEPPFTEESVRKGEQIFQNEACKGCHKTDAAGGLLAYEILRDNVSPEVISADLRGQFDSLMRYTMSRRLMREIQDQVDEDLIPDSVKDNWGGLSYAANVTSATLHGGRRPIDIYRRIYTGVTGTPMPSFAQHQLFADDPDKFWNVVHFIIATTQGRPVTPVSEPQPMAEETGANGADAESTDGGESGASADAADGGPELNEANSAGGADTGASEAAGDSEDTDADSAS